MDEERRCTHATWLMMIPALFGFGRIKLEMALLSKDHTDTGNIESSTTDGFWKYAVSLDRHGTVLYLCSECLKYVYCETNN